MGLCRTEGHRIWSIALAIRFYFPLMIPTVASGTTKLHLPLPIPAIQPKVNFKSFYISFPDNCI